MRRLLWCAVLFLLVLPPSGPYVLATLPLLLILVPFFALTVWAVLPPETFRNLVRRALGAWRRDTRKLLP
jgi:hypothetical protein